MMAKKKKNTKDNAIKQRSRHRLLTFMRVSRYGVDSFVRNSWLTVAATAVMTITLMIILTTFMAQKILNDTVSELKNKVDMSIYLKTDTTDEVGAKLVVELKKLSSVKSASFISSATARQQVIDTNKNDPDIIEAMTVATNKIPSALRVVVVDINDTTQLQKFVDSNSLLKPYINADYKPSFAGDKRSAIESIGRAVSFAQKLGIAAGALFVIISSLIIFNTIRMAIFNRKEEIQMMKLIGADKFFIRGPFVIESVIYGFVAALIAGGLGIWAIHAVSKTLDSYKISVMPTVDLVTIYALPMFGGMILVGAIIGIISSLLATHKYLRV
ncbi:FtsX-like permease family protein [Candidatus Saccharibacteria bacterium]|nr:FtsX-like permease family protein [Candidatus Saccharibacteria bacterium]